MFYTLIERVFSAFSALSKYIFKTLLSFKMPKLFSTEIESTVRTFSEEKNSHRVIKDKLEAEGTDISISTISRILNDIGISRQAATRGEKNPKFRRPPVTLFDYFLLEKWLSIF
jgi:hypothetical protein